MTAFLLLWAIFGVLTYALLKTLLEDYQKIHEAPPLFIAVMCVLGWPLFLIALCWGILRGDDS